MAWRCFDDLICGVQRSEWPGCMHPNDGGPRNPSCQFPMAAGSTFDSRQRSLTSMVVQSPTNSSSTSNGVGAGSTSKQVSIGAKRLDNRVDDFARVVRDEGGDLGEFCIGSPPIGLVDVEQCTVFFAAPPTENRDLETSRGASATLGHANELGTVDGQLTGAEPGETYAT